MSYINTTDKPTVPVTCDFCLQNAAGIAYESVPTWANHDTRLCDTIRDIDIIVAESTGNNGDNLPLRAMLSTGKISPPTGSSKIFLKNLLVSRFIIKKTANCNT